MSPLRAAPSVVDVEYVNNSKPGDIEYCEMTVAPVADVAPAGRADVGTLAKQIRSLLGGFAANNLPRPNLFRVTSGNVWDAYSTIGDMSDEDLALHAGCIITTLVDKYKMRGPFSIEVGGSQSLSIDEEARMQKLAASGDTLIVVEVQP